MSSHESEWVYSTPLTKKLKLTELNQVIHSIPSLSHPAEICVFACGYAFNPVMFPMWLGMIHFLTYRSLRRGMFAHKLSGALFDRRWRGYLQSKSVNEASLINTAFYLASVLMTLAFTELGKASFATTRPTSPLNRIQNDHTKTRWIRRYGALVSSLKSKHSFPSGDCAQAMNLCMFLSRYVPVESSIRNLVLFGVFVPGVAFARVFYWCHWVEDTFGGIALAFLSHVILMPTVGDMMMDVVSQYILS